MQCISSGRQVEYIWTPCRNLHKILLCEQGLRGESQHCGRDAAEIAPLRWSPVAVQVCWCRYLEWPLDPRLRGVVSAKLNLVMFLVNSQNDVFLTLDLCKSFKVLKFCIRRRPKLCEGTLRN